jgi:hypothetical protein
MQVCPKMSLLKDAHSMPGIAKEISRSRGTKIMVFLEKQNKTEAGNRPPSLPVGDTKVSLRTVRRLELPNQMD